MPGDPTTDGTVLEPEARAFAEATANPPYLFDLAPTEGRGGFPLVQQVPFYPVTDASFATGSYHRFATCYFLRRHGMQWFWDQYTTDPAERVRATQAAQGAITLAVQTLRTAPQQA